jgi:hypothetical protein
MLHPQQTSDFADPFPLLPNKEEEGIEAPLSLSTDGKIFKWQDNRPFGKIIHGAIRAL